MLLTGLIHDACEGVVAMEPLQPFGASVPTTAESAEMNIDISRFISSSVVLIVVHFVALLAVTGCCYAADRPPNVVLMLADDLGYSDVGVYGAQGFATPHLDRL